MTDLLEGDGTTELQGWSDWDETLCREAACQDASTCMEAECARTRFRILLADSFIPTVASAPPGTLSRQFDSQDVETDSCEACQRIC